LQQGKYVASVINAQMQGHRAPKPFSYFDKGSMAIVGRNFAVMEIGSIRTAGFIAWLAWATIHVLFLAAFGNRVSVMTQWVWTYLSHKRGSRLILGSGGKNPLFD
jgi:NADH dehydrogenase FAD-containing subunit